MIIAWQRWYGWEGAWDQTWHHKEKQEDQQACPVSWSDRSVYDITRKMIRQVGIVWKTSVNYFCNHTGHSLKRSERESLKNPQRINL